MTKKELTYLLTTSGLLTLSFPPFPLGFLVPFALALFLRFIKNKSSNDCFRLGYWLGLIWGALTLFWIAASTLVGAILVIAINALHYAFIWWLFAHFRQNNKHFALISLPFIWVGTEYLRLFSDLRFNWLTLSYTQTYYLPFIQISEITGYLSISFVLVVFGVLIFYFIESEKRLKWISLISALIIILVLIGYGLHRMKTLKETDYSLIHAGLVQPNVDPYQKWDPAFQKKAFRMLLDGTRQLVIDPKPDFIVWPETATPFFLRDRSKKRMEIQRFIDSTQIFLLTGTPDYKFDSQKEEYHTYNAAFFFRPDTISFETYYKMALVPGSETMPFKDVFPVLRKVDVGGGDFFSGQEFSVFNFKIPVKKGTYRGGTYKVEHSVSNQMQDIGLSAVICYESVFPHIVRQFIKNGSNLLTIITNDGWFGLTSGPYQHSQYAVFRAIENRVSIIRCANTGISSFIDPMGRKMKNADLITRKNMKGYLPIKQNKTFYTIHGDWFGKSVLYISIILLACNLIWSLFKR